MRILALAAVLVLSSCRQAETAPALLQRDAVEFKFVGSDTLQVHERPDNASKVMTEYQRGEPISVLSRSGDWAEVRVGTGSGWAPGAQLVSQVEQEKAEADSTSPHFTTPPESIADLQAHGEIVLEAKVNTDGEVSSIRVLRNSTGSPGLEFKNIEALKKARFTPAVRNGQREPFIYEHRVSY